MNTFRVSVENLSEYSNLEFGERGENAVTRVLLDFTAWVEEFGAGVVNLYVKRSGDTSAYPVPLSIEGTVATWLVSDTDTYKMGRGEAEYVYVANEKVEKTAVFGFYVKKDIGQPSVNPPSPYETWMESLMALSNTTLENAQDAEEWAEKAEVASQHYPIIINGYWWVWRVEQDAYVNTDVKAEGQGFTIVGTVQTVNDLPETAAQGTYYNVGESAPYAIYMWQDGVGWMYQGQLQGPTGATFVPSISDEGVISWTNDGGLPNPEAKSVRGPQGIQGVKGESGDSAGFGVPTATADQTIGQASVSVSASGPDTAKVFAFSFSGIKGEKGDTGNGISGVSLVSTSGLDKTYRITFTETSPFDFVVHDGRGISSVTLNADYTLTIGFTDGTSYTTDRSIRGEKGADGAKGDPGASAGFGTPTASVDANTGTPSVAVTASGPDTAKVFNFQFNNLKGERGVQGQTGATGGDGTTFTPSVSSEGVISWTNDGGKTNPQSVNIKGPQGERGATGQGVPTGGSAGQVLKKASATDYDTEWGDGGGGGGLYVVNVQYSSGAYRSDKTHKEITDAIDAGYTVVVAHATDYYQLVSYGPNYSTKPVSFSRTNHSGGQVIVFSLTISGGDDVTTFTYSSGSAQSPVTPQNPNPVWYISLDESQSPARYVFEVDAYSDFSDIFADYSVISFVPTLYCVKGEKHSLEYTNAVFEGYTLTDAYTTNVDGAYTGHLVFSRVVGGATPKIATFEISQDFYQYDFSTATVTYSEIPLALGT